MAEITVPIVSLSSGFAIVDFPEIRRGIFVCSHRSEGHRVYEAIFNLEGRTFETKAFDTYEEARDWLLEKKKED